MEIFIEKKVRGQHEHLKEEQLFNQMIAKEDNSCYSMCLILLLYNFNKATELSFMYCLSTPGLHAF